jgi:hypothetical protein
VICKETVTASINCTGFIVLKSDCFNKLPRDTFVTLQDVIRSVEEPKSDLWDVVPRVIDESDFKIQTTWELYKKHILKNFMEKSNTNPSIVSKYRYLA